MKEKIDIEVGQKFWGVLGKLIVDPETNRIRVITLKDQAVRENMFIECSKKVRESNPIGTIFKINVKISKKPTGRLYLHSLRKNELLKVDEWLKIYG